MNVCICLYVGFVCIQDCIAYMQQVQSQLLKVFTYLSIYYTQELKYLLYVKLSKESEGITWDDTEETLKKRCKRL